MNSTFNTKSYLPYVYLALIITAITSYTNFGHNTGDEYSQIFEFAAWKLGHLSQSDLRTYEFTSHMRPSIQVWAVVAVYKIASVCTTHVSPFVINYIIYFLSGVLGIYSILVFTKAFLARVKPEYHKYFLFLSLFSWLVLYTNPHFNSENICGHLFLLAVGLLYARLSTLSISRIVIAGLILGLSFSCRFQIGFAILALLLWLLFAAYKNNKLGQWFLLSASMLFSILVFNIIADYYFYGQLVFSTYNYYYQNIAAGIMNRDAGVSPWYAYLVMVSVYVPFGPIYVLASIYYIIKYPWDILSSIIGFFVLCHVAIGHKEVRFLLPILGFMPVVIMVAMDDLVKRSDYFRANLTKIIKILWAINLVACFSLLLPAATEIGAWRYLYNNYQKPIILYYNASVHQKLLYYKKGNVQLVTYKSGDPTPCPLGSNCLIAFNANSRDVKPNYPLVYTFFPFNLEQLLPAVIVRAIGHFNIYEIKNIEAE